MPENYKAITEADYELMEMAWKIAQNKTVYVMADADYPFMVPQYLSSAQITEYAKNIRFLILKDDIYYHFKYENILYKIHSNPTYFGCEAKSVADLPYIASILKNDYITDSETLQSMKEKISKDLTSPRQIFEILTSDTITLSKEISLKKSCKASLDIYNLTEQKRVREFLRQSNLLELYSNCCLFDGLVNELVPLSNTSTEDANNTDLRQGFEDRVVGHFWKEMETFEIQPSLQTSNTAQVKVECKYVWNGMSNEDRATWLTRLKNTAKNSTEDPSPFKDITEACLLLGLDDHTTRLIKRVTTGTNRGTREEMSRISVYRGIVYNVAILWSWYAEQRKELKESDLIHFITS
eukprot:TRINITY_DN1517_c0_g1_i3.p1 TRINITY_DN1517_c0_g1~~TRINITY_DN1517_c0_g1_i3.p1  ORF type:complete len:352 (-),score=36.04 TRINITY_DN1517_c0_g1_i3:188-1243(-)